VKVIKKFSHCAICLHIQGWISDKMFESLRVPEHDTLGKAYATIYTKYPLKGCPCCDCVVREMDEEDM